MFRKIVYLSSEERQCVDLTCSKTLRRRRDRVRRILGFLFRSRLAGAG